jgi:hypothetical protein
MDISVREFSSPEHPTFAVPMKAFEKLVDRRIYSHATCSDERLGSMPSRVDISSKAHRLESGGGKVVGLANGMWDETLYLAAFRFPRIPGLLVTANAVFTSNRSKAPAQGVQPFPLLALSGRREKSEFIIDTILCGHRSTKPTAPKIQSALEALSVANAYVVNDAKGQNPPDYLPEMIRKLRPQFGDEMSQELEGLNHLRMTLPLSQPRMMRKAHV